MAEITTRNDFVDNTDRKASPIKFGYNSVYKLVSDGFAITSSVLKKITYESNDGIIFDKKRKYQGYYAEELYTTSHPTISFFNPELGNIHFHYEIIPDPYNVIHYTRTYMGIRESAKVAA